MYVVEADKKIIESWANQKTASISFRAAGACTLQCLERGAGAKPHEILDKTLKLKAENTDADRRHNAMVKDFLNGFAGSAVRELLMGLVGHWTEKGIDGIYLTALGAEELKNYAMGKNRRSMPYLLLGDKAQKAALAAYYEELSAGSKNNQEMYFFSRLFFSGDYDVHDMLQARKPVSTKVDIQLLKDLQTGLQKGRIEQLQARFQLSPEVFDKEKPEDYQRVQHGPQANYIAEMFNQNELCETAEELNVLVSSVAAMSPPVMVYDSAGKGCQWIELASDKDIIYYYEKVKGNTVKGTWKDKAKREKMIRWTIRNAINLIYFKKGNNRIVYTELLEKLPNFWAVYENALPGYVKETLKEMTKTGILKEESNGVYVKVY